MVLNDNQERIVQEGIHWFKHESSQTFEFGGEAGTGKSVVLNEIVRRLGLSQYQYMPMAYTGQASIIMRLKGFPHAKTIHSSLYEVKEVYKHIDDHVDINSQFNVPKKCLDFVPKMPSGIPKEVELFVIDEGFMPPLQMRRVIESFGRKVLVAGDPGQLPPVAGDPAYLTGNNVRRLTQIMRQAENNPIIYLAHRARRGLPIHCGMYGNNAIVIEEDDLSDDMLRLLGTIVCGTNNTRDSLNNYIRYKIKNIKSDIPVFGDRVICRNNNWYLEKDNISLANGLTGTVVNMPDITTFDGKIVTIDFAPDLANILFESLPVDYKYLTSNHSARQEMKNLPYKTGEKFEYSYALTTHLSQGAEYHSGIYIEEFMRANMQNQLNYTGITRFRNNLIYVKKSKRYY